ncbi:MAG: translational GTPase TypA [Ignavibacteriae bacterium]|nr:translational GTPase TypA [Ignavibacteria bacterium]MBI3365359.1 translational GTPase TypA [Ignavibacteriota bacterium]
MQRRNDIRNIAIIAHVDHGKTTLVDYMLRQTGTFRENQEMVKRVMDSNELERERGITILAKNTAVFYTDAASHETYKINIVDTPGHSDFAGEVERTLKMVDGVLLLVDAAEGPLPGTKFVLKKSLELNLQPIVVINKIDRKDARPHEVLDEVFELFLSLGANNQQLDFPTIYCIAKQGIAKDELEQEGKNLEPLFRAIIGKVPGPPGDTILPFQMLVTTIDYNDYLGRLGIGRIERGNIHMGSQMKIIHRDGVVEDARVTKIYTFEGLKRREVQEASAGDIIAIAGMEDVDIGETIADAADPRPLHFVTIEEPTLSMNFVVNNSPFAGQEGKYVTTRNLGERLARELRSNVSLRVELTDSPDVFKVSGRGELHLGILIETMRREGYEFQVSAPEVIYKRIADVLSEPMEHVIVDVPDEFSGTVIQNLGARKGIMKNMIQSQGNTRLEFIVPARGLLGFRSEFMTETKGTGILHHNFHGYEPYKGDLSTRNKGAVIQLEDGQATAYAMWKLQERMTFFIEPTTRVYKGMVVGENSREEDIIVNVCKTKQLTNMRASGADEAIRLEPPKLHTLEQAIEWISDDEYIEVTPKSLRLRKRYLDHNERTRMSKKKADAVEIN